MTDYKKFDEVELANGVRFVFWSFYEGRKNIITRQNSEIAEEEIIYEDKDSFAFWEGMRSAFFEREIIK